MIVIVFSLTRCCSLGGKGFKLLSAHLIVFKKERFAKESGRSLSRLLVRSSSVRSLKLLCSQMVVGREVRERLERLSVLLVTASSVKEEIISLFCVIKARILLQAERSALVP